ncbi:hypothetical protein [Streptomyces sp. NPDC057582]|uniref:hypothetical protein n=1 Tax=Streptomyces sp. NPDC057582 TaxID=3346174 RepID=UPI003681BEC5
MKNWRVLSKVRTDPKWATALVRALLVLTNQEVALTDDLHRSHPPVTSMSTPEPTHTRPVTCYFTMHTTQCAAQSLSMQQRAARDQ